MLKLEKGKKYRKLIMHAYYETFVVVGQESERQVSSSEGQSWARSHGMLFIEASAKTKQGIQSVFDELMRKIIENPVLRSQTSTQKSGDTVNVSSSDSNSNESGCC